MELINLKGLNLTTEEPRDTIKFIAQKRGISTKQLLSTINPNPKRENNEILITKNSTNTTKSSKNTTKSTKNTTKIT